MLLVRAAKILKTGYIRRYHFTIPQTRIQNVCEQAVRSLGPLGCTCYQACAGGLATRWSTWDLHLFKERDGNTHLGGGFALRCCQRFSFLDVAFQPWGGHPNWRTSGRAISVLSYWR